MLRSESTDVWLGEKFTERWVDRIKYTSIGRRYLCSGLGTGFLTSSRTTLPGVDTCNGFHASYPAIHSNADTIARRWSRNLIEIKCKTLLHPHESNYSCIDDLMIGSCWLVNAARCPICSARELLRPE